MEGQAKSKEHEIAVMIWNDFIVKTNNEIIDFSFKNLEDKIKEIANK